MAAPTMTNKTGLTAPSDSIGSKKRPYPWFSMAILLVALVFFLLPIYVMVNNGLKDAVHVDVDTMWNVPDALGPGGFIAAWQQLSPNVFNRVVMVVPATCFSLLLSSINGYFLSKWKFRGSDVIFALL